MARKRQPQLSRDELFALKPVHNPAIEATVDDRKREVTVKLPRRKTWWLNLLARFSRLPEYGLVTLDEVGTSVWEMCDGERNVRDLIRDFAAKHQLGRKEAEVGMLTYLRQLGERGIIVFEMKDGEKYEGK
jgi:hypothetical protein